jgi:predicted Zn-dependent protease
MIKGIDRGLYITDVMGMHTINSLPVIFLLALLVSDKKGPAGDAVRGVTIAGNIQKLFAESIG